MNFLIIKTSSLGDIIQAFPALQFLRKKFPEACIDWVVEAPFAELVKAHPDVNQVFSIESKKWGRGKSLKSFFAFRKNLQKKRYRALFDLQGNCKSAVITFLAHADKKVGFNLKSVREWPNAFFTNYRVALPPKKNIREDYLFQIQSYLGDFEGTLDCAVSLKVENKKKVDDLLKGVENPILVAPKTAWPNKELALEKLISFLQKKEGFFLFSYGKKEELKTAQYLNEIFKERSLILDPLPLFLFQYLMSKVNLIIAMDSLPLHLAGTTHTPTYSFFGPTKGEKFAPIGPLHQFEQGICPYGVQFDKQCPKLRSCKTGKCLK